MLSLLAGGLLAACGREIEGEKNLRRSVSLLHYFSFNTALARGMENGGAARLIVKKYICGGVTLAAACMDWRICFD